MLLGVSDVVSVYVCCSVTPVVVWFIVFHPASPSSPSIVGVWCDVIVDGSVGSCECLLFMSVTACVAWCF